MDKPYTIFVNIGPGVLATYVGRHFDTIDEAKQDILTMEQQGPAKLNAEIEDTHTRRPVLYRFRGKWIVPTVAACRG
jgi:hypothetical protein